MKPRVLNKAVDDIPPEAVYVGRPTIWGNPFIMGLHGDRVEVIAKYHDYLTSSPRLMALLPKLKGKDLVCWCAPRACHADILLILANRDKEP